MFKSSVLRYLLFLGVIIFVVMFESGQSSAFNLGKNIFLGFSFLFWFIWEMQRGRAGKVDFGYLNYFIIFLFLILVSSLNAVEPRAVFIDFMKWCRLAAIYLLIICAIKTKADLYLFLMMLGLFMAGAVLYGIYEFIFNPDFIQLGNRATSIFNMPTLWSFLIIVSLPVLVFLLSVQAGLAKKIFFWSLIGLSGLNLYLTGSRLGLFFCVTLVPCLLYISVVNKKMHLFLRSVCFIVLGSMITIVILYGVNLAKSFFGTMDLDPSFVSRKEYLDAGFNIIRQHPFLGIGAGNYPVVSNIYLPDHFRNITGFSVGVHNVFLHIAMEAGLFAAAAFFVFIFLHLRKALILCVDAQDIYIRKLSRFIFLSLVTGVIYVNLDILPATLMQWYFGIFPGLVIVLENISSAREIK